ncbi:MAG: response regulator [bacterium]
MDGERVLLIDDEEEFTSALSERMETRGLKVDTAASGEQALQVDASSYDAVVLDMAMPGMDGIETMKKLLEKNPNLQVIFLTGHGTVQKGVEAVKLGALDFLEKPVKMEVLLEKIKEAKTNKVMLVEQESAERMKEILGKMGW